MLRIRFHRPTIAIIRVGIGDILALANIWVRDVLDQVYYRHTILFRFFPTL